MFMIEDILFRIIVPLIGNWILWLLIGSSEFQ